MATVQRYNPDLTYNVGDYVSYGEEGKENLYYCLQPTSGTFNQNAWLNLGYILHDKGYVVADETEIEYRDDSYMKHSGGIFTGEVKYNIPNQNSRERNPFRFKPDLQEADEGDLFVLNGGNGTTVISSGTFANTDSNLEDEKVKVQNDTKDIALISNNNIRLFTNATSTNNIKEALTINNTGDVYILEKKYESLNNDSRSVATEGQIFGLSQDTVHLSSGGTVKNIIKYDTGVNPNENSDLTTVSYVQTAKNNAITSAKTYTDSELEKYLKLTGGTISGDLTVSGSLTIANKTGDPSSSGTSVASEYQVKTVNDKITNDVVHKTGNLNEDITGQKTFKSQIVRTGAFSAGETTTFITTDSNNKGHIQNMAYYTGNQIYNRMYARNVTASKGLYLDIVAKDNGEGFVSVGGDATRLNNTYITSSTDTNYLATMGWVNNPNTAKNVVHRDTSETITGTKTIYQNNPTLYFKSDVMDITSSNWKSGRHTIAWCMDKNGYETGGIYNRIDNDNDTSIKTSIYAMSRKTGEQKSAFLTVGVNGSGVAFTTAPTPALASNDTNIATTSWVRTYTNDSSSKIVHTNTTETISGVKTFSGNNSFTGINTFSNKITSSKTTGRHIDGNKGEAIINSTASAGSYTMLAKMNTTNGYMTLGTYGQQFNLYYTAKSIVDAGTNSVSKTVSLLNESGDSTFPGHITIVGDTKQLIIKDTNALATSLGESRTSSHNGGMIQFRDKDGRSTGYCYNTFESNGSNVTRIQVTKAYTETVDGQETIKEYYDNMGIRIKNNKKSEVFLGSGSTVEHVSMGNLADFTSSVASLTGQIKGRFRTAIAYIGSSNTNCWFKLGTFNSTSTYNSHLIIFKVWNTSSWKTGSTTGRICTRSGSDNVKGTVNAADLHFEFDSCPDWLNPENFKILYKQKQGSDSSNLYALFEIWVKTTEAYTGYSFSIQDERQGGGNYNAGWTLYNKVKGDGTESQASLPSGYTQKSAEIMQNVIKLVSSLPSSPISGVWYAIPE